MKPSTDTVPAMLTPGEFVIRKDAAEEIGPEKLHMLNNIDRLGQSALLENAKSPMGYQEGGKVKLSDYWKTGRSYTREESDAAYREYFGDKYGGGETGLEFAEKYEYKPNPIEKLLDKLPGIGGKRAYDRAKDYSERVFSDPESLERREDEREREIDVYGKILQDYVSENDKSVKDMFMMASLQQATEDPRNFGYSMHASDMDKSKINQYIQGSDVGYQTHDRGGRYRSVDEHNITQTKRGKDLFGIIPWGYEGSVKENPGINPMLDIQKLKEQIDNMKTAQFIPGYQEGGQVYADKETIPYKAGKRDQLSGGTAGREEKRDIMAQRVLYPTDHFVRGSAGPAMGVGALKGLGLNLLLNSLTGGATGGYNALAALTGAVSEAKKWGSNKTQIERMAEGKRPFDPVHFRKDYESGDIYSATKKGWRKISPDAVAKMEEHFPDYMRNIDRYQEGGPVMHNKGQGQMNEVLSLFGEKSQDADGLQKLAALATMQRALDIQKAMGSHGEGMATHTMPDGTVMPGATHEEYEAMGMRGGGYVPQYQEGGSVEPPMPTGEQGPQQAPMSSGQQAYYKPPMEQLGMDEFEYSAYIKFGPELYKYFPQNFKPKEQWTAYDSLVSDGIINPYEVSKDSINVLTNDQLNELLGQRKPPQ